MGTPTKSKRLKVGDKFYMNETNPDGKSTLGDYVEIVELTRKLIRLKVLASNAGTPIGTTLNMVQ